jgi:AcrR family transcriptional regulator
MPAQSFTERPLVARAIDRTVGSRYDAAADEIDRIVEATYRVIERTGNADPPMREILGEGGVSRQLFYRHFESKDELMLVILDDGRRRLADYLRHKMDKAEDSIGAVRAWILGTLAQARSPKAASRTRPFIAGLGHLHEQYPEEHRQSIDVLVSLLDAAIGDAVDAGLARSDDTRRDATAIYLMATGAMEQHLRDRSSPSAAEGEHLVQFALRALGAVGAVESRGRR